MREQPKFKIILRTDYFVFSLFILFFLSIGIEIYSVFFEPMLELELAFGMMIVLSLIGVIARLFRIRRIFSEWSSAKAVITRIWFYRGTGNISYTFIFEGQEYRSSSVYIANKLTRRLRKETEISILVNPNKPKRTLIDELYR